MKKAKSINIHGIPNGTFKRFIKSCKEEGKNEQDKLQELIIDKLTAINVYGEINEPIKLKKKPIFSRIKKTTYKIAPNIHKNLKIQCAKEGKTIKRFINDLLVEIYG